MHRLLCLPECLLCPSPLPRLPFTHAAYCQHPSIQRLLSWPLWGARDIGMTVEKGLLARNLKLRGGLAAVQWLGGLRQGQL